MTDYTAPTDDIRFVLHDFLQIETQAKLRRNPPRFHHPRPARGRQIRQKHRSPVERDRRHAGLHPEKR